MKGLWSFGSSGPWKAWEADCLPKARGLSRSYGTTWALKERDRMPLFPLSGTDFSSALPDEAPLEDPHSKPEHHLVGVLPQGQTGSFYGRKLNFFFFLSFQTRIRQCLFLYNIAMKILPFRGLLLLTTALTVCWHPALQEHWLLLTCHSPLPSPWAQLLPAPRCSHCLELLMVSFSFVHLYPLFLIKKFTQDSKIILFTWCCS